MTIDPTAIIHPSAIIEDGARIGAGVRIGPFCMVGAGVTLRAGVEMISHATVAGLTEIGAQTRIWPFASVGHQPQDLKYAGEPTRLTIGAHCLIREGVTLNLGTAQGGGLTSLGDGCLLMVGVHVGHDCVLGNGVVVANNVAIAGHVTIGDSVIIGGNAAIHQFCRIGRGAMIGGLTGVERDIIPYGSVMGNRAHLAGLNLVGLKRRGAAREDIHALRGAWREMFEGPGTLAENASAARAAHEGRALVAEVADFILSDSARSFVTPKREG
ncbi:MAG: UDP-N-acetylglucosamine acyltransferase [Paracoccaceae bacterium]|jgi:UDP-N-acetylglucosamine acyltransferase